MATTSPRYPLSDITVIDLSHVYNGPYATFLTQANVLATGTLTMVQCEKRELKLLGLVGYKPGVLGKLKVPPVPPKTIFEKDYSEIRPPNITLCNH